jgi:sodium/proline symporter
MIRSDAALIVFAAYGVLLTVVAVWAARRTHNATDFFLGRRRLGAVLLASSHVANATSGWMLLVIAGAAFTWGYAAIWIWFAMLCGYAVNGFYVAPRLRLLSMGQGSITIAQVLAADAGDRFQVLVLRSAALIVFTAFLLEIGAVVHAGGTLAGELGFDATSAVIAVFVAIVAYTAIGGYWAASVTDLVQVSIMLLAVLLLPLLGLAAAGGLGQLQMGFAALGPQMNDWLGARSGVVAIAFVAGVSGYGFGLAGQPHALSRFMAAKDEAALRSARWIALLCVGVLVGAALVCGWCASVLYAGLEDPQRVLFAIAERILPPWASAMLAAAMMCAMFSGIGNRLLVVASSLSVDTRAGNSPSSFAWARVVLVLFAIVALCFSLYSRGDLLEQTLFAFSGMGAAFGPLLLVRLAGKRVRPGSTLGAMWAGFVLTALFHALPDAPGDFLERVLPFVAALGIALSGGERRRNPDRADRSQETVHDRVPI